MAPIVHRLEQRYAGQIEFVYLDVDDERVWPLMEEFNTLGLPHFFLLDAEGNIVDQWLGPIPEEKFVRVFEAFLAGELEY